MVWWAGGVSLEGKEGSTLGGVDDPGALFNLNDPVIPFKGSRAFYNLKETKASAEKSADLGLGSP